MTFLKASSMRRLASAACSAAALALGLALAPAARAADLPPAQVGLVSHVKVVSDKTPDVSSLEAWKKSYIKEGMSDKDKAMAIFNTMVAFQNADAPGPREFIEHEDLVLDPIKMMNVYGYSFCSISSAHMAALARAAGLKARNATINNHVVPELWYDNAWHLMDADLIEYFPKADGTIASLQEIVDGVSKWEAAHPDFPMGLNKKNDRYKYMANPGWKTGPEILLKNPFYDERGWLPDTVFAWGDTMHQFGKLNNNYESGYSMGYQVNIELRPGEKLTRNWSNKGLFVNMDSDKSPPDSLKAVVGQGALRYSLKWGDLAPGRIGNGTLEYNVPLTDPLFRKGALAADNLATKTEDKQAPALHVADATKPGVLEIRMPSSYVYLTGTVDLNAIVGNGGDIKVLFSDNNGEDWKDVTTISASGDQKLDLNKLVIRKYDYRLRFVMDGKGTGLDSLKMTHDVEESQRALPALAQGSNTIHFSAGPNQSTITYEASTYAKNKDKALTYEDLHAKVANNAGSDGLIHHPGNPTTVDFPVATPQDMKGLRIFAFWRSGSPRDTVWNVEVSFDEGKTFKPMNTIESGQGSFNQTVVVVNDIPPGTRSAVVRYVGTGSDNGPLLNFRIDADYSEADGGFRPVKVTYIWTEDGKDQTDVHVAAKSDETYTINCKSKPTMKSVIMELAN